MISLHEAIAPFSMSWTTKPPNHSKNFYKPTDATGTSQNLWIIKLKPPREPFKCLKTISLAVYVQQVLTDPYSFGIYGQTGPHHPKSLPHIAKRTRQVCLPPNAWKKVWLECTTIGTTWHTSSPIQQSTTMHIMGSMRHRCLVFLTIIWSLPKLKILCAHN